MTPLLAATLVLVGTAVVVLVIAAMSTTNQTNARLKEMLQPEKAPRPSVPGTGGDALPTLTKWLSGKQLTEKLYVELMSAGLRIRPSEFVGIAAGAVILSQIIAAIISKNILGYFVFGLLGVAVPVMVLKSLQQKRRVAFDGQIVDALTMMSSSLRSGFSFLRAMQMVAQEMPAPISQEFQRVIQEVNVGRPTEDALRSVVTRVKSYDFDLAVTAVLIQLQVGGNLADILETIAGTIRERVRILGEMRALTAEGKISGVVLVLLPVGMGVMLTIINPSYMSVLLHETLGHYMMAGAVAMQVVGGLVINRMLVLDI